MSTVTLKNIVKIYPNQDKKRKNNNLKITEEGVLAVQDFNLEIADKEFVVLVGPSGCGKSTTLRMIAGLEEISKGQLEIDGKQKLYLGVNVSAWLLDVLLSGSLKYCLWTNLYLT